MRLRLAPYLRKPPPIFATGKPSAYYTSGKHRIHADVVQHRFARCAMGAGGAAALRVLLALVALRLLALARDVAQLRVMQKFFLNACGVSSELRIPRAHYMQSNFRTNKVNTN